MSEAELTELKTRVKRLEAERAVQCTFMEYLYHMDVGYNDGILDIFTDDAHLEVINFPPGTMENLNFKGREQIAPLYTSHSSSTPTLSGGHHACNIAINVAPDCSSADLSAYFMTSGGQAALQGGMYQGTLVPDGNKWRFKHYRIVSNWGWRPGGEAEKITDSLPATAAVRGGKPPVYEIQP